MLLLWAQGKPRWIASVGLHYCDFAVSEKLGWK
jgi:hypothetical protein